MKKLLFALTAVAMIAVSCKDIQEPDFMKITQLTLTATTEQPVGTRTMVAGAGEVFWEKGDEIKVFAGTASGRFVSDVESGIASTALFTGSLGGGFAPVGGLSFFRRGCPGRRDADRRTSRRADCPQHVIRAKHESVGRSYDDGLFAIL